jgi:hypothetical protein
MKQLVLFLIIISALTAKAQDPEVKPADTVMGWKVGGTISLSFTQVGLSNWASGGENALSGVGAFRLNAIYKSKNYRWENYFFTSYGIQKQGDQDLIKNEDKIEIISKLGRRLSEKWNYTANLNFRTQWYKGYKTREDTVKFSDFFAPAYITLALGFDYKPNDNLGILLSPLTGKFTIVADDFLSSRGAFGVEPGKNLRSELGGFIKVLYIKENIVKNVNFATNLDLFSNYIKNPEKIDVNWEVNIDMKINDFLSANLNTYLIYDYDVKFTEIQNGVEIQTDKVQFKEAISVGLTYKF